MKKLIFSLPLLLVLWGAGTRCALAQTPGTTTSVRHGSVLPATCDPTKGELFFVNSDSLYACTSTNTWVTAQGVDLHSPGPIGDITPGPMNWTTALGQSTNGFLNPLAFGGGTVAQKQQAALAQIGIVNNGWMVIPPNMGPGWFSSTATDLKQNQFVLDTRTGWDLYREVNSNAACQVVGLAVYVNVGGFPTCNIAVNDAVALFSFMALGNLNHPGWAANFSVEVPVGTAYDAGATGVEIDVANYNSEQSVITGPNRKWGLLFNNTSSGPGAKTNTSIQWWGGNNNGGGWFHGISMQNGNVLTDLMNFSPVFLTITSSITASGSPQTVNANTGSSWIVNGAWLSLGSGGTHENVQIISSDPVAHTVTAVFSQNHLANTTGQFLTSDWALNFTNTAFRKNPILLCDLPYSLTAHVDHNCGINILDPSSTEVTPLSWLNDGTMYITPVNSKAVYVTGNDGTIGSHYVSLANGALSFSDGIFGQPGSLVRVDTFVSNTANPSNTGVLQLAKTDFVGIRNNANTADLPLGIDGSDNPTFNSAVIPLKSTATTNHATCWKTATTLGSCSTVVASDGSCTCN